MRYNLVMSPPSPTVHNAVPFLKWAGGKRQLLSQYGPYFPPRETIQRYFEPFIGSAAVYFYLQPTRATLSDRNEKLIDVYRAVQQDVEAVIEALQPHRNEEAYYYAIRAQDPARLSLAERAARLIYLNRTCYNGLYRENSRGEFNVPFGRYKNPKICNKRRLRLAAQALQGVTLRAVDFVEGVATAGAGDFVYFDPPYAPVSATSSFTGYDKYGFNEADQIRLAQSIHDLSGRGCRVMLSNSSAPLIYELYEGHGYRIIPIQARRSINSKPHKRGPVKELLILNYE